MNNNEEFLKRHNIRILDTNKRFARQLPFNYHFFKEEDNYDIIHRDSIARYGTERLFTIEIPESNLTDMQDFEEQVFNNMKTYGAQHYHLFNTMMEQKQKEKYLRNKHPAVKKAFEHYSLMLKLAESGEIDNAGY